MVKVRVYGIGDRLGRNESSKAKVGKLEEER
jgi:hypothetical protein